MDPLVDVDGIHFAWGATPVLHGVDLTLGAGELCCLLGPNGTGKTTLVENILGTVSPQAGAVRVMGENPRSATGAFWSKIGLVQQNSSDHPKWRVKDLLEWTRLLHESVGAPTRPADELLQAVGLADKAHSPLSRLSGGQRRRVDFALALLARPGLLVLDEPTTGLDPVSKAQVHDIVGTALDEGAAVLYTTHDLAEAQKIATRIAIMNHGRIVAEGSADSILDAYSRNAQVTWDEDGTTYVHSTDQPEAFLRTILSGPIEHLTVTRPTLEEAYLALMDEDGPADEAGCSAANQPMKEGAK